MNPYITPTPKRLTAAYKAFGRPPTVRLEVGPYVLTSFDLNPQGWQKVAGDRSVAETSGAKWEVELDPGESEPQHRFTR